MVDASETRLFRPPTSDFGIKAGGLDPAGIRAKDIEIMSAAATNQLLFVCTGNTCRSPMAEVLMRKLAGDNLNWSFASAGIAVLPGSLASTGARNAIAEKGLDLSSHEARQVSVLDLQRAALIVTMTHGHRDALVEYYPEAADKIFTIHSFGSKDSTADVADPYGGSIELYRMTRDEIETALADLVLELHSRGSSTGD